MRRDVGALEGVRFDLLVLGGGITGAGVALDAATRGLRVALIDKGDFAGGTSSVSSKLVHGGLRYLEHGDFALVHEALRERRRLLHNAPHLVWPLRFVIPFRAGARVPGWKWRLGLTLYDALAGRDNLSRSRPLSRAALLQQFPTLQAGGLRGGAAYFDAQMDDARLCVEVLQTAAGHGATVANYVEATAFEFDGGRIRGVRALDHVGGGTLTITARQVLNATGPWVDAVCRMAGDERQTHLQPTKGVHVIVPDCGLDAAFVLLHPADGRVLFVIPWLGKTLIGTTDTLTAAGPDHLNVQPDEIAYLLQARLFAAGKWTAPSPPIPDMFAQPAVLVAPVMASKYPPGHSLLLAIGARFGAPVFIILVLGALRAAMTFVLARRLTDGYVALATCVLLLHGDSLRFAGSYFSETTTGALLLVAWYALLRWHHGDGRRWIALVASPSAGPRSPGRIVRCCSRCPSRTSS